MTDIILAPADFRSPAILLSGPVGYDMYASFRDQLAAAPQEGLIVVELSTLGGDPEVARMMGEDVRYHSELEPGKTPFRVPRQGGDLFGRLDLHELLHAGKPLPDARHPPNDPRAQAVESSSRSMGR